MNADRGGWLPERLVAHRSWPPIVTNKSKLGSCIGLQSKAVQVHVEVGGANNQTVIQIG